MSEQDDDDAQLKQLRAVWVSMREEDPPDSGLAALMAAAREKADEMKDRAAGETAATSPGWWSKLLAAFRRPPVLALASVAVLVGGVLVLANRDKGVGPSSSSVALAPEPPMQTAPNVEGTAHEAVPAPQQELMDTIAKQVVTPRPRAPERQGGVLPDERKPAPEKTQDTPGANTESVPPPEPPKPTEAPVTPVPAGGQTRAPAKKPVGESIDVPGDEAERGAMGDAMAAPQGGTVKAGAAKPSLAQLLAQCQKAAENGDCAAVRALAARIKAGDAAVYRQRVAGDASIARCLEVRAAE